MEESKNKAKEPLFSVLMANYNNGKYIKEAIESVLNQSYKNWELIIVDDASKDNSIEIIKPFLKDNRIKLFLRKKNKGCGAAKKHCAEKSNGEYFGVLDPDDILDKDAVKTLMEFCADNPDYGLVYSTYYNCNENLEIKDIAKWVKKIPENKTNLHSDCISFFVAIKKSDYDKTEGFDEKQKRAVDKDIYFKIEEVSKTRFVPKPLYYYRIHDKSLSQGSGQKEAYAWFMLAKYKAFKRRKLNKFNNLSKKEISNSLIRGSLISLKDRKILMSAVLLLRLLKVNLLY